MRNTIKSSGKPSIRNSIVININNSNTSNASDWDSEIQCRSTVSTRNRLKDEKFVVSVSNRTTKERENEKKIRLQELGVDYCTNSATPVHRFRSNIQAGKKNNLKLN